MVVNTFFIVAVVLHKIVVTADEGPILGDLNCPCLTGPVNLTVHQNAAKADYNDYLRENILNGTKQALTTFGVGCKPHDEISGYCKWITEKCTNVFPKTQECLNLGWCERSWCYVDSKNCTLTNQLSFLFVNREFSYASCGYMDTTSGSLIKSSLKGDTLKVAFNDNTGGYLGAYNPKGSFVANGDWTGPAVEFVSRAAALGGFNIEMVSPPVNLKADANEYFNSTSSFDYCVYAAALGYVDFCVGAFTLTNDRVSSAPWFVLGDHAIQLITFLQEPESAFMRFWDDASTLLKPFAWRVWLVMSLLFMPLMSFIILYFEYGKSDGAYPSTDKKDLPGYFALSLYEVFQSLFAGYGGTIVSRAGKAMMIGIGFFNILILATYTANLAAILNTNDLQPQVTSLEEAYERGYRVCGERMELSLVNISFPKLGEMILRDPADGLPGFTDRKHVLNAMKDEVLPEERENFCEIAFTAYEDLAAMQGDQRHCNKTRILDALALEGFGFPINPNYYESLWTIFQTQYNQGTFVKDSKSFHPDNECPNVGASASITLSTQHMSGVWAVTFVFAVAGLIMHKTEMTKLRRNND